MNSYVHNEAFIYIYIALYCVLLYTQSTLQSYAAFTWTNVRIKGNTINTTLNEKDFLNGQKEQKGL